MIIREYNYNEDGRALYVEFSTEEDGDNYYRSLWLSLDEIKFYSPSIFNDDDLYILDEELIIEILSEYSKDNDFPEEQNLWYLYSMSFLKEEYQEKLTAFVKFVKKELDLKETPKIVVQNGRKDLKTTANYNYSKDEKVIKVNGKNRALVDIMRSIAHEMVHHKQFEEDRLLVKPKDIGGDIEDEANAKAGQFIKMFAKEDQTIYDE